MIVTSLSGAALSLLVAGLSLWASAWADTSFVLSVEVWAISCSRATFSMVFDTISSLFGFAVVLISTRVYLFSRYYVKGMANYTAFHLVLLVFIFSILILIFSPNIFRLILG